MAWLGGADGGCARHRVASPVGIYWALLREVRAHPANPGRIARPLATVVAANVHHQLPGQPVVGPLGARSRVLAVPRWLTSLEQASLYRNPPDPWLTGLWPEVLRPGDLALDVGANKGHHTILAAEAGATVVAVEPSTATVELLRANLRLNDLAVEVVQAAAGAAESSTWLTTGTGALNHVVEDLDRVSVDRRAQMFPAHRPDGVERVDVVTIDAVVGERTVMACKLDVEGQEAEVLTGAQRLLREHRIDYLQVENNPDGPEALRSGRRGRRAAAAGPRVRGPSRGPGRRALPGGTAPCERRRHRGGPGGRFWERRRAGAEGRAGLGERT